MNGFQLEAEKLLEALGVFNGGSDIDTRIAVKYLENAFRSGYNAGIDIGCAVTKNGLEAEDYYMEVKE